MCPHIQKFTQNGSIIKPETVNYIEENIGTKLTDLGLRGDFINLTPKAREVKAKINE